MERPPLNLLGASGVARSFGIGEFRREPDQSPTQLFCALPIFSSLLLRCGHVPQRTCDGLVCGLCVCPAIGWSFREHRWPSGAGHVVVEVLGVLTECPCAELYLRPPGSQKERPPQPTVSGTAHRVDTLTPALALIKSVMSATLC